MTRSLIALSALFATPALAADDTTGADVAATAPATVSPTAEQEAVYRALTARHSAPECDELDAMSSDPLGTYLFLIEHAEQPAWVGMRSARCVMLNHAKAAQPTLETWVVDADKRGLAILVAGQLDAMPLDIATSLATLALTDGPDPDGMRKRIARSDVAQIAAIADLPLVNTPTANTATANTATTVQD